MTGGSRRIALLVLLVAVVIGGAGPALCAETSGATGPSPLFGADGKIKLRILYTTGLSEQRSKDFADFLKQNFAAVATTDYKTFRAELAAGFDVVILDYGAKRPGAPVPALEPSYSRATVTIGAAGSHVCDRLRLKPGYL